MHKITAGIIILLLPMSLVLGADSTNKSLFELSIEELLNIPVTVATKQPIASQDAPSNITLFTRSELEILGVQRLVDLFEYIPGFYPMFNPVEGNQSYLVTRGHAQKYASTILVLFNGQRVNEDYTGGINYFSRFLNLKHIDKIEVIRGPGSVLYGSNAFNGVINIISRYQPELSVTLGSPNSKRLDVAYQTFFADWEMGVGFVWEDDSGDDFDVEFDMFNLQTKTTDPKQVRQVNYQFKNNAFIWNGLYLESDRHNYYLFRRLRDGQTHVHLEQWLNSWELDIIDEHDQTLSVRLESNNAKRETQTAIFPQDNIDYIEADYLEGELFEYRSYRYNLDAVTLFSEQHKLNYGIEWVLSSLPSSFLKSNYNIFGNFEYLGEMTTFNSDDERIVLNRKRKIHSAYTEWEAVWSEQFRSTLGLRHDRYNDVEPRNNPRLSLIYAPSQLHRFKFIYGEAYRAPSLGDLYDVESGLTAGNANLKPSVLESTELVYQYRRKNNYIAATLFHNHISDLIAFRVDQNNDVYLANVADNDSSGVELEWRSNWDAVIWSGHASYWFENETEQGTTDGATPSEDLSPEWFIQNRISWNINENMSMSWIYQLRDEVDVLQSDGSLELSHLAMRYVQSDKVSWQLKIRNLFDKQYATGSYIPLNRSIPVYQEYPARGREVWLSLSVNW